MVFRLSPRTTIVAATSCALFYLLYINLRLLKGLDGKKIQPHRVVPTQRLHPSERILFGTSLGPPDSAINTLLEQFRLEVINGSLASYEIEKRPPKVAIISVYAGGATKMIPLTRENKLNYAKRHGYDFFSEHEHLPGYKDAESEFRNDVMVFKLWLVRAYLKSYDWVMWSDSDAIFLNHSKSLEDAGAVDARFDFNIAVGPPEDFRWGSIVNMGHFVAKSTRWTVRFLEEMLKYRQGPCPKKPFRNINGWLDVCSGDDKSAGYWLSDQGLLHAMARSSLVPTDYECHIKLSMMRDFDSEMPWFDDGDLVVHLPGRGFEDRRTIIDAFVAQTNFNVGVVKEKKGVLKNNLDDWRTTRSKPDYLEKFGRYITCASLFENMPL